MLSPRLAAYSSVPGGTVAGVKTRSAEWATGRDGGVRLRTIFGDGAGAWAAAAGTREVNVHNVALRTTPIPNMSENARQRPKGLSKEFDSWADGNVGLFR